MRILIILLLFPIMLVGQQNCAGSFEGYTIKTGNIRATVYPGGSQFINGKKPGFQVSLDGQDWVNVINSSSLWLAGFDHGQNYKASIERNPFDTISEFGPGLLNEIGVLIEPTQNSFDTVWHVEGADIHRHLIDYNDDSIINNKIESIIKWPGKGNSAINNGANSYHFILSNFYDNPYDGIYSSFDGDYPYPYGIGNNRGIPDNLVFSAYNDFCRTNSERLLTRMEIGSQIFSYNCEAVPWTKNTLFVTYMMTNKTLTPIDSFFIGVQTDFQLGCNEDDYLGTLPDLKTYKEYIIDGDFFREEITIAPHTVYFYNDLDGDGLPGICEDGTSGFSGTAPIISITSLNYPLHSHILLENETQHSLNEYRYLNGRWGDNTEMTEVGKGYFIEGLKTKYIYNGNFKNANSWTAISVNDEGIKSNSLLSIKLGNLRPFDSKVIQLMYMVHHIKDGDFYDNLQMMKNNIREVFEMRTNNSLFICDQNEQCLESNCVWPGDMNADGIADQRDLLDWGVMNSSVGSRRETSNNWKGYHSPEWDKSTPENINYKHGDADGNGFITSVDLELLEDHFLRQYDGLDIQPSFKGGLDIQITADPIDDNGNLKNIQVKSLKSIPELYGLAFDIHVDTSLWEFSEESVALYPSANNVMQFNGRKFTTDDVSLIKNNRFAFVGLNNQDVGLSAQQNLLINFAGLSLKPGFTKSDIPNGKIIDLANVRGIDKEGNYLDLGSVGISYSRIHEGEKAKSSLTPVVTSDAFYIQPGTPTSAFILNGYGERIKSLSVEELNGPVNISDLTNGMYFVHLVETGEMLKVVKIGE